MTGDGGAHEPLEVLEAAVDAAVSATAVGLELAELAELLAPPVLAGALVPPGKPVLAAPAAKP